MAKIQCFSMMDCVMSCWLLSISGFLQVWWSCLYSDFPFSVYCRKQYTRLLDFCGFFLGLENVYANRDDANNMTIDLRTRITLLTLNLQSLQLGGAMMYFRCLPLLSLFSSFRKGSYWQTIYILSLCSGMNFCGCKLFLV